MSTTVPSSQASEAASSCKSRQLVGQTVKTPQGIYRFEVLLQRSIYGAVYRASSRGGGSNTGTGQNGAVPRAGSGGDDAACSSSTPCASGNGNANANRFAIKVIDKDRVSSPSKQCAENPWGEVVYAEKMRGCRNLLVYHEVAQDAEFVYIILPFADYEDLFEALRKRETPFSEAQARFLFCQILSGALFLRSRGLAFRDHSLENVLLFRAEEEVALDIPLWRNSETGNLLNGQGGGHEQTDMEMRGPRPFDGVIPQGALLCRIADPGQAVEVEFEGEPGASRPQPTPWTRLFGKSFRPPEAYLGEPYDAFKVDSFCLGWMLFNILTKHQPFDRATHDDPHWRFFCSTLASVNESTTASNGTSPLSATPGGAGLGVGLLIGQQQASGHKSSNRPGGLISSPKGSRDALFHSPPRSLALQQQKEAGAVEREPAAGEGSLSLSSFFATRGGSNLHADAVDLLSRLLHPNPNARLALDQIASHAWMRGPCEVVFPDALPQSAHQQPATLPPHVSSSSSGPPVGRGGRASMGNRLSPESPHPNQQQQHRQQKPGAVTPLYPRSLQHHQMSHKVISEGHALSLLQGLHQPFSSHSLVHTPNQIAAQKRPPAGVSQHPASSSSASAAASATTGAPPSHRYAQPQSSSRVHVLGPSGTAPVAPSCTVTASSSSSCSSARHRQKNRKEETEPLSGSPGECVDSPVVGLGGLGQGLCGASVADPGNPLGGGQGLGMAGVCTVTVLPSEDVAAVSASERCSMSVRVGSPATETAETGGEEGSRTSSLWSQQQRSLRRWRKRVLLERRERGKRGGGGVLNGKGGGEKEKEKESRLLESPSCWSVSSFPDDPRGGGGEQLCEGQEQFCESSASSSAPPVGERRDMLSRKHQAEQTEGASPEGAVTGEGSACVVPPQFGASPSLPASTTAPAGSSSVTPSVRNGKKDRRENEWCTDQEREKEGETAPSSASVRTAAAAVAEQSESIDARAAFAAGGSVRSSRTGRGSAVSLASSIRSSCRGKGSAGSGSTKKSGISKWPARLRLPAAASMRPAGLSRHNTALHKAIFGKATVKPGICHADGSVSAPSSQVEQAGGDKSPMGRGQQLGGVADLSLLALQAAAAEAARERAREEEAGGEGGRGKEGKSNDEGRAQTQQQKQGREREDPKWRGQDSAEREETQQKERVHVNATRPEDMGGYRPAEVPLSETLRAVVAHAREVSERLDAADSSSSSSSNPRKVEPRWGSQTQFGGQRGANQVRISERAGGRDEKAGFPSQHTFAGVVGMGGGAGGPSPVMPPAGVHWPGGHPGGGPYAGAATAPPPTVAPTGPANYSHAHPSISVVHPHPPHAHPHLHPAHGGQSPTLAGPATTTGANQALQCQPPLHSHSHPMYPRSHSSSQPGPARAHPSHPQYPHTHTHSHGRGALRHGHLPVQVVSAAAPPVGSAGASLHVKQPSSSPTGPVPAVAAAVAPSLPSTQAARLSAPPQRSSGV
uniref:Protein kinase domain-containing protein n=1 Tax=Chromera velia CCMP2878 TaxID=1169474 RepID=A0A0G4FYV6_9ALVE|eukprot:Cvel_19454.t1-p1 / transcript=Cvel_19454.t1 / gene=Cvel_19454 / organism=Chromera_velia_CCMP2878 / gene_product=Calcium-dependent protein kinase 18, putative / transcript_product=Calcium-dependent protein kinase 18, putative / location=Cvel_scaffold1678:26802-32680(+) / protein_length=1477 / sequence_SO=supercontig / SO=protein_coding / is_pseudo=false